MLLMLMMRPQRCSSMWGSTAWIAWKGPERLILRSRSHCSSVTRVRLVMTSKTPALFTRMSTSRGATASWTAAASAMSNASAVTRLDRSPQRLGSGGSRSAATTWAPAAASAATIAEPSPPPAPVTSATRGSVKVVGVVGALVEAGLQGQRWEAADGALGLGGHDPLAAAQVPHGLDLA